MPSRKPKILIADDDFAFRVATLALLEDHGYAAEAAANGEEALKKLSEHHMDLVLSDLVMPGTNGIQLLQRIRVSQPHTGVIILTGFASIGTAVEAMRSGARDYVTKPCSNDELLIKVQKALDEQEKERELIALRSEVREMYTFGNIVGQNSKMREVYRLIEQVAVTDVPALILGETGTGKELVARAIHYNSARRDKPFVVINCSALPETLLESELFGHEKGAFTGADRQRIGKFEEADGGTVFLDEIGDVPMHIQTKLLRVLQEKELQRVGGNDVLHVDNRIVAATNRDLPVLMTSGRFREDLFYRLNVFPVHLPPLRERLDDLPGLVEHLLKKHASLSPGGAKKISPSALPSMMNYPWRGNIRELENLVKRAIIKCQGDTIMGVELPSDALPAANEQSSPAPSVDPLAPYKEYLSAIISHAEKTYLVRMLRMNKGNVNQIARAMDIDRKTLYRKMTEYALDPSTFRE